MEVLDMDIDILLSYSFLINKLKLIFRRVSKLWHYLRKRKDVVIKPTIKYFLFSLSIIKKSFLTSKNTHRKISMCALKNYEG